MTPPQIYHKTTKTHRPDGSPYTIDSEGCRCRGCKRVYYWQASIRAQRAGTPPSCLWCGAEQTQFEAIDRG